jgi:hypothetical protein
MPTTEPAGNTVEHISSSSPIAPETTGMTPRTETCGMRTLLMADQSDGPVARFLTDTAADCVQLPIRCSGDSQCTCSHCCGKLGEGDSGGICQPTCR